jgi:hypothetical protein
MRDKQGLKISTQGERGKIKWLSSNFLNLWIQIQLNTKIGFRFFTTLNSPQFAMSSLTKKMEIFQLGEENYRGSVSDFRSRNYRKFYSDFGPECANGSWCFSRKSKQYLNQIKTNAMTKINQIKATNQKSLENSSYCKALID